MSDEASFASAASAATPARRLGRAVYRELPKNPPTHAAANLELTVSLELGRVRMALAEVAQLEDGAILQLDKRADDPIDIVINEQLVARGEVVVIDGRLAVRITEVISANRTLD